MGHHPLNLVSGGHDPSGSFVDSDRLLPLFADPDARGARRWSEMFDGDRCEEIEAMELFRSLPSLF